MRTSSSDRRVLSCSAEGEKLVAGQRVRGGVTGPVDAHAGQNAGFKRVESNLIEAALGEPCPYLRGQVGQVPVPGPDHGRARTAQGRCRLDVRLMSRSFT